MKKFLIAAAVLLTLNLVVDQKTVEAGHRRCGSSFSLSQLLPFRIVSPSRNTEYRNVPSQGYYYDPSIRFRYGYGGYLGNYYRDQNGFFYNRMDSHYWHGIHR